MKKWYVIYIYISFAFFALSCKQEQQGDSIVIPPGMLVSYSNSEFVSMSKSYYTVELQKFEPMNRQFFTVQDITPTTQKENPQEVKYILPKDREQTGVFILKVNLSREGVALSAFVLPGQVNNPNFATTLTVELLKNYPQFDLLSIKDQTLSLFQEKISKSIEKAKAEFGVKEADFPLRIWMRFIKNYVSRDKELLDLFEDYGIKFSYDSNGVVSDEPFPFGTKNSRPFIDFLNSTSVTKPVQVLETIEATIRGKAQDAENDYIFYRWYRDGVLVSKEEEELKWTPGYMDSRSEDYLVALEISDGSVPYRVEWKVTVVDKNRLPEVTADCPKNAKEWQAWKCTVSAVDYDGDALTFRVSDKKTNARVKVNGLQTDNVTRQVSIPSVSKVDIEITPNNTDAGSHSIYLELQVEDAKLGVKTIPLIAIVEDINSPPEVVIRNGSPIQLMQGGASVPHEWDYCAKADPDGFPTAYRFMVEIRDPDNQSNVAPRNQITDKDHGNETIDNITVSLGGSLLSLDNKEFVQLSVADGCPANTNEVSFFCYEWRPGNESRQGTLTLTMLDDHGGVAMVPSAKNPDPILLTAEDRNQKPCLDSSPGGGQLTEVMNVFQIKFFGTDNDGIPPWAEFLNVPFGAMPLLSLTSSSDDSLVFKKSFFKPSEWIYRFQKASLGGRTDAEAFIKFNHKTAGIVTFQRGSPFASDLTIPKGTLIQTSEALMGPSNFLYIFYETQQDVILGKYDVGIAVPVKAISRSVPIGGLNRFISAVPLGLTIQNTEALSDTNLNSTAKVNRVLTDSAISIPAGTVIGTSEKDGFGNLVASTVRYETIDNVTMKIGISSVNIRIRRQALKIPANSVVLTSNLADPSLSVSNPQVLNENNLYTLARDLNLPSLPQACWTRRISDGEVVPQGASLTALGSFSNLVINSNEPLDMGGSVHVSRSNSGVALTIPAGTEFRTANLTRYQTLSSTLLAVGVNSVDVLVKRTNDTNPPTDPPGKEIDCYTWSDYNYSPEFLGTGVPAQVNEGSALLGYEISVSDNKSNPLEPKDWLDRHTFVTKPLGPAPEGAYSFCRSPADSLADLNVPACVSCQTPASTYYESASCYLRYKPQGGDVSSTFNFEVVVNDNGLNNPLNSNIRKQVISVSVIELNKPPSFSDSTFSLKLANNTQGTSELLGNFVEGIQGLYRFYLIDENKGSDLKKISTVTLQKVWQFFAPTGWTQVPSPTGFLTELESAVNNPSGWGSKTTYVVKWTPNDYDAKRFAGPNGLVIQLRACDLGNSKSPSQCQTGFYKLTTENINNIPYVSPSTIISTFTVQANSYNTKVIDIFDTDYSNNSTMPQTQSSFQTAVTMCSSGITCQMPNADLASPLRVVDSPYLENSTVVQCQTGGVLTDRKMPWLVLTNGVNGTVSGALRFYRYSFQWCPQKRHIGTHKVFFNFKDNGDEDIRGPSSLLPLRQVRQASMIKVVAPVFFESPLRDPATGTALNWMKRAFSLAEYRYELLINNSKGNLLTVSLPKRAIVGTSTIGAPLLEVRSKANPSVVAVSNSTTITSFNPSTHKIFLVWRPYGCTTIAPITCGPTIPWVSTDGNTSTYPYFEVRVADQSTGENQLVNFRVQVKDSFPSDPPVILTSSPTLTSIEMNEQLPQLFQVTASDPENDPLIYRWSLDGTTVWDRSGSYSYTPTMEDAFLPMSSPGVHTLEVEILDGKTRTVPVKRSWTINVRNTVPSPQRLTYANAQATQWTLSQAVLERGYTGTISNISWGPSLGASTNNGSVNNYLLFTGSYTRASTIRHFVWQIPFNKSYFTDNNPASVGQGTEILPWQSGRKSENISFIQDAQSLLKILVSSQVSPDKTFVSTVDAVQLSPDLKSIASLSSANICNGLCGQNFYTGMASQLSSAPKPGFISSSGPEANAVYKLSDGTGYYFFSAENRTELKWGFFGSTSSSLIKLAGNDKIGDVAVNPTTKRLYMTVQDPSINDRTFIYIFDLAGITSGSIPLLTNLQVTDGVNRRNRIMDLAIDSENNRIYAWLPGQGGVAVLSDDGLSVPTSMNISFLSDGIGPSLSDQPGKGRKLVYNPTKKILYGVSKDSNQVFAIDVKGGATPVNIINVFGSDTPLDEIITFDNDGLTLAIDRTNTFIYYIR